MNATDGFGSWLRPYVRFLRGPLAGVAALRRAPRAHPELGLSLCPGCGARETEAWVALVPDHSSTWLTSPERVTTASLPTVPLGVCHACREGLLRARVRARRLRFAFYAFCVGMALGVPFALPENTPVPLFALLALGFGSALSVVGYHLATRGQSPTAPHVGTVDDVTVLFAPRAWVKVLRHERLDLVESGPVRRRRTPRPARTTAVRIESPKKERRRTVAL